MNFIKKHSFIFVAIMVLVVGMAIAGCGSSNSSSPTITPSPVPTVTVQPTASIEPTASTEPTTSPEPSSAPSKTNLVLNATTEYSALSSLVLPATINGFTLGSSITFDNNASPKTYNEETYVCRIKLGGSDPVLRGITFTAKAGDVLTVLAMSSSGSGTGRNVMVAPFADGTAGTGVNLGESGTANITAHTNTLPSDGTYVVYSSNSGINIYYISVIGN